MMNGDTFFGMMRNIYAVFNKPVPSDSSPFVMSVWERVNHVPDEAVPYIVNQIADEERMPQNVGRAILRAWESWQTSNPGRMVHIHCDVCGGAGSKTRRRGSISTFCLPARRVGKLTILCLRCVSCVSAASS